MRGHQMLRWAALSLITPPLLFAQEEQLRFENFSATHGLSQTYIPAIIQDRRGFMWFATRAGLLRYDGNQVKIYRHVPGDSSSLTDNDITTLYEDRQGILWVGTYNGLNRYDHTRDRFKQYDLDRLDMIKRGNHTIGAIYEDTHGRFWVGTGDPVSYGGLYLMNRQTGLYKRYQHNPEKLNRISSNAIRAIGEDAQGNLWIAHLEDGLDCFDPDSERFTHYKSDKNDLKALPTNLFHCAQRDDKGALWFGGEYSGLIKLILPDDHRDNPMSFKHYTHKNYAAPASLEHLWTIFFDRAGEMWVATEILEKFDRVAEKFVAVNLAPIAPGEARLGKPIALCEDHAGNLWIGTADNGIIKIDKKPAKFYHYRHDANNRKSLGFNHVEIIHEGAKSGKLWLGDMRRNLDRFDPSTGRFEHFLQDKQIRTEVAEIDKTTSAGVTAGVDKGINDIWEDRYGMVWMALEIGLIRLDPQSGQFTHFRHQPDDPYSLSQNRCQCLYEDRNGDLWIGTREGLNRFDRKGNRFMRYYFRDCNYSGEHAARSVNVVRTMHEDRAGNFWVGTACGLMRLDRRTGEAVKIQKAAGHTVLGYPVRLIHEDQFGAIWAAPIYGLGKVDQQNGIFVRFRAITDTVNYFAIDRIYNNPQCFSEGPDGYLWVGAKKGLRKFDLKAETYVAHYDENDGLPSSNILKILRDQQGYLWLLTENGISIFNENAPAGRKFYNPDRTVEVDNAKTHPGAFIKSRSGEIYWGGTNGVHRFFPKNLHNNSFIPQVTLTGFQLFDAPAKLDTAIAAVKQIELSHDENFFTFEFTAMDYTNPRKNQYAYKLEGFDADWVHAGNRSQANYTNVPPGAYTFRVKGSNSDGVWNEQGASIKVIIAPPFWQTWWFRIAAALAVVAFLTALYNYRVSKLLEIERTRLRIARDLHDEIGSSLSSIALSSEFLRGKATLNEKEKGLLNSIDATAHRLIEAMNDIVWAINPGMTSWISFCFT